MICDALKSSGLMGEAEPSLSRDETEVVTKLGRISLKRPFSARLYMTNHRPKIRMTHRM
jgi:hypothetical protein